MRECSNKETMTKDKKNMFRRINNCSIRLYLLKNLTVVAPSHTWRYKSCKQVAIMSIIAR